MKIRMNKLTIFLILALIILSFPLILADQYVTTPTYFYVPSDVSFTVRLPGPPSSPGYNVSSSPVGTATTWISFNATDVNAKGVQPQTEGIVGYKQSGSLIPIFYVTNDGNTPISFKLQIAGLPACLDVCANSTCGITGTCGGATFYPTCNSIKVAEQTLVTGLLYATGQDRANITLYADFTACTAGTVYGPNTITHHSTL